jgi:hypothetical protein
MAVNVGHFNNARGAARRVGDDGAEALALRFIEIGRRLPQQAGSLGLRAALAIAGADGASKLHHPYVGQPVVYKVDPDFTPSADYLRLLEGVPLAAPLERDAERGLALRGEGAMMNELGAKWR